MRLAGPQLGDDPVIQRTTRGGVGAEHVFFSLERNMKCALGQCGRCQFGPVFVCGDGPVFSYAQVEQLLTVPEL